MASTIASSETRLYRGTLALAALVAILATGAIGLSSLSLGYTPGTGLGLGAQKTLFKNLDAVFSQSFNYPQRQSIGLRASPNVATAVQLTFFNQQGSGQFLNAPGSLIQGDPAITASQPASGTSGFAFSLQRRFR